MTDRIPTLEELLNWSNSVGERKDKGEPISELEHDASEAVFDYVLEKAFHQMPMQVYYMVLKRGDVC